MLIKFAGAPAHRRIGIKIEYKQDKFLIGQKSIK